MHKLQVNDPAQGAKIAAQGGRLIADYGSYQLYNVPQAGPELLMQVTAENRDEYNLILLNAGKLDTSKAETQALRKMVGDFKGKRLHLVQFAGPVQPAWRESLQAAGVQIVAYIPYNTYLVYGDAQSLAKVQELAASAAQVQWEGAFLNDYRIHPAARTVDALGAPRSIGTDEFAIQLVADAEANAATLQLLDQLKLEPFNRQHPVLNYLNLIVRLAPESLATLAARPDVISVMPFFRPHKMCERQAQILAGNLTGNTPNGPGYLAWLTGKGFAQSQFLTSGFVVDVTDSGIDNGTPTPNHPGLYVNGQITAASRVAYNRLEGSPNPNSTLKGCDGHGTINAHIIAGFDDLTGFPHTDSAGYHYGLGICPFVRVGSSVIFDSDMFTFPSYTALQSRAYRDGARVSANSWGGGYPGAYDFDCQEYDALVRDAQPGNASVPATGNQEMVIVFAAGNDGPGAQTASSPGTAKNVITVGATENVQPFGGALGGMDGSGIDDSEANSANDVIFFSSRGPCEDGRHKPDIMSPGTHVSGGVAQELNPAANGTADSCFNGSGVSGGPFFSPSYPFYPDGQQLYTACSGTSQATPGVAGGAALLRQYFINNFGAPPSPAMTKAFLMNSTRYLTGTYANDSLWSDKQGMGAMNLGTAFDGAPRVLRDQLGSDLFTATGQTRTFTGTIADSKRPTRITLAWTDAPGSTTGNAYNNNLDLTVTINGTTYKGNVFNGAYSVPGGAADNRNNVESVFLPAGVSGTVTITITAVNINSDGVPNNGIDLDQDFALVVYNCLPGVPPVIDSQPTSLTVLVGQPAAFSVQASGTAPLGYQWRKDSVNLVGATSNVFSLASAQLKDTGGYSVVVSNPYGAVTSSVAPLTVLTYLPLPLALNNSNLTWTTDSATPWYGQTNLSHDGVAAGRSYFIGHSQQTRLSTTVTGPGKLTFWWKVSSQTNADILSFQSSGSGQPIRVQISGEVDWQQQTIFLPAGPQTLEWTYAKNASVSTGLDAGFVDQVTYTAGSTAPFIVSQPQSQGIIAASPVAFSVGAQGTPPLSYQWRFNGTDIPGATGTTLTLANPALRDAGLYSVRVDSPYGSVASADAYLGIVPLLTRGDNSFQQLDVSAGATNVIAIAAGAWHSLGLRGDGTVMAWGDNYDGQCKVPTTLKGVMGIAAGGYHSLALKIDGTVVGWGANYNGQATPPKGLANVVALAAGAWHSLALRANGTVVAWGDNTAGQSTVPANLTNVVAIAAAGSHSLALRADGTVVAWGENLDALGNFVGQSVVPWGLANVVAIGAGDYHSLAVKSDGTVVAWGDDSQGQCEPPQNLTGVVAIAGGGAHSVALKANGTVATFGNTWSGLATFPSNLSNVVAVAAGNSHTLVLVGSGSTQPRLLQPLRNRTQFSVLLQTFAGKNYALESNSSLGGTNWTPVISLRGNGALQLLQDPAATTPQRFYRVRQW